MMRIVTLYYPVSRLRIIQYCTHSSKWFPINESKMLPSDTFKGSTAFVTRGGNGLGKSIANHLVELGANVFIVSRKERMLKDTCDEIRQTTGKKSIDYAVTNICDNESVINALNLCKIRFDIPNLIVNTTIGNFISPTERLSSNIFNTIIDINLKGIINVTMESAKLLIEAKKGGSYLSITTIYAQTGSGYVVPCAIAKAAVEAMTKSLAAEWGQYGLRFNSIASGPLYTQESFSPHDPTGIFLHKLQDRIPSKRLGSSIEFTNLATYLLSNYASWINGDIINFDGGELVSISGEFNVLSDLLQPQDWDMIELLVNKTKKS